MHLLSVFIKRVLNRLFDIENSNLFALHFVKRLNNVFSTAESQMQPREWIVHCGFGTN